ncbi:unnamed protein product [Coffea canephora]|uniref:Uncharacterized protein n=1 Tax=Coffea canephora TaxID=49390 RepID=A0A068URS8_COFCA|nr:unnamed protein product [Coffea canephora]
MTFAVVFQGESVAEKDHPELWQQENCEQWLADSLDCHIKRWSAGKEGNLRALLSSLQDVLWPECKWDPVSLAGSIIPASVKKVYARARIRKVCDMLKEAWKKYTSEELY